MIIQHLRIRNPEKSLFFSFLDFMSNWNFMPSWVEQEKRFLTSGPDWFKLYPVANSEVRVSQRRGSYVSVLAQKRVFHRFIQYINIMYAWKCMYLYVQPHPNLYYLKLVSVAEPVCFSITYIRSYLGQYSIVRYLSHQWASTKSECSGKSAHVHRLARVFAARIRNVWM